MAALKGPPYVWRAIKAVIRDGNSIRRHAERHEPIAHAPGRRDEMRDLIADRTHVRGPLPLAIDGRAVAGDDTGKVRGRAAHQLRRRSGQVRFDGSHRASAQELK